MSEGVELLTSVLPFVDGITDLNGATLNQLEVAAKKGAANGYAPLDGTSKVPIANLPPVSGVDYIGPWAAGTAFKRGDVVRYNGFDYLAVNDSTGVVPPVAAIPLITPGVNYATTLPASPFDGQEAILVDSVTNPSYQWRFRYNAGSTSAYKWEFIGGTPLRPPPGGSITLATTQTAPIDVTNGPTLTVPRAGVYRYIFGGIVSNGGTFVSAYGTTIQIYAGATVLGQGAVMQYHTAQYAGASISTDSEATLAAGAALNFKAWMDRVSNNSVISNCWIQLTPVRVA